jgi:sulfoxide reductase catalytic subunit YedY
MPNTIHLPEWYLPDARVTSENAFRNRRQFLAQLGLAGVGIFAAALGGCSQNKDSSANLDTTPPDNQVVTLPKGYPAARNAELNPAWPLTPEKIAGTYNNFYEFSLAKDPYKYVSKFVTTPWPVEIGGLVEKPTTVDASELAEMFGLEERIYRFRCVEAWAMIVPWTGFQFSRLIEKVVPKPEAKFVRFQTFNRPDQAPGIAKMPQYPWPYHEGLRLDEAMNQLTLLATGIYGKPLPRQHGAPLRLVVPWKYGYKSIKSIVKIEFTAQQPKTFWETLAPEEYPFDSNVNPAKPHPRWSQATERMIDTGDRVKTQLFNGYGKYVASLY